MTEQTDEEVATVADDSKNVCGIDPPVWDAMCAVGGEEEALDAIEAAWREPGGALAAFVVCLRRAGLDVEARDGPGGAVVRFRDLGRQSR
jgi:hypothetical protein